MLLFAIYCSYKQYKLNADLSVEIDNNKYRERVLFVLLPVSLVIVFLISLDTKGYIEGYQYSSMFLNGVGIAPFVTLWNVPNYVFVDAIGWLMVLTMVGNLYYGALWTLFYLITKISKEDYTPNNWEDVQKNIAPNPSYSSYYVLTRRNGASPIFAYLAITLTISSSLLISVAEKKSNKFYDIDAQMDLASFEILNTFCKYGYAVFSNGVTSCDNKNIHNQIKNAMLDHPVIIVWDTNDLSKNDIVLKVASDTAPPTTSPETTTVMVKGALSAINKVISEKHVTDEHKALWKKQEKQSYLFQHTPNKE